VKRLEVPSKAERTKVFKRMDNNGNGILSLAEVDKAVIELYPHFNHKPALMRAYKAADKSGDGWIGRREFRLFIRYLGYFNDLWDKFEAIDTSHDRRITPEEFANGCGVIGLPLSAEEADEEFVQLDANGGGFILFDEFCSWAARRHIGEDAEEETTSATTSAAHSATQPAASTSAGGGAEDALKSMVAQMGQGIPSKAFGRDKALLPTSVVAPNAMRRDTSETMLAALAAEFAPDGAGADGDAFSDLNNLLTGNLASEDAPLGQGFGAGDSAADDGADDLEDMYEQFLAGNGTVTGA